MAARPLSPYRKLQARAKARGIPADQKGDVLEALLAEAEADGEGLASTNTEGGRSKPSGLWTEGGMVDRLDKALSRPFNAHTLPKWLEVALSIPGTWFGCPTTAVLLLPMAIGHIGNIGACGGEDAAGTRIAAAVSVGAGLLAHLWLASRSLALTETEAPTPAQLTALKTDGMVRLYHLVPAWGNAATIGYIVVAPHVAIAVLAAVGPPCAVGAACFFTTAWFAMCLSVHILKELFARERPALHPAMRRVPRHLPQMSWMLRAAVTSHTSFPSGDAAAAVVFLFTARMTGPPGLPKFIVPLTALSLYGRMYFHAHHLLDVTVGAAMGGLVTHYVPELYGVRPTEFNWTHVAATQAGLISSMLLLRAILKNPGMTTVGKSLDES